MARKLSRVALRAPILLVVVATAMAGQLAVAERDIQVSQPANNVVENPFVATSQPKPRIAAEEPQSAAERGPTTYQNPFANASKAPPTDTSLRRGPISRWQRPTLPRTEPSAVKAAVLSESPLRSPAIAPTNPAWDQLPPAEHLQQIATAPGDDDADEDTVADTVISDDLPGTSPIIHSPPATAATSQGPSPTPTQSPNHAAGPSLISAGPDTKAIAVETINPLDASETNGVGGPISDSAETAEDSLAQAQQASLDAESAEQLTVVVDLCDRALRTQPTAKVLASSRRLAAWAHNRRGELYSDDQRPDEAIKDFQDAITMDPKCSLAIHNRAVTLAQRNQFAAALRDFNRVIELNPGLALAYRNRAELLAALGRMDEAVADYGQAIESLPDDAALLRARAHAYQRLGDFKRAAVDLDHSIQLAPHDPDAVTQRGNLAAEEGKYAQAQEDFNRAIAIDANWAEAYRSLAWMQATCPDKKYRDAKQALATAQQAADLSQPDDYLILDTLAAANACAGKFPEAVQIQEKALAAAPRDVSTPLEQRLALYKQGHAFSSGTAKSAVRTASHEAPVQKELPKAAPKTAQKTAPRPSPTPRKKSR